jgi:hypothetical protein
LSALAAAPAQAVILDFQSLESNGSYFAFPGQTYTEKGFKLDIPNPGAYSEFLVVQTGNTDRYAGSTTLMQNSSNDTTRLTAVSGGSFTLSSIGLTGFYLTYLGTAIFTSTKADNTTVTQSFTTDSILNTIETFSFTNDFTSLVAVSWNDGGAVQFDNINVSAATSVPEPFTVLGTIFGAGYGVALKRKLAKAAQD